MKNTLILDEKKIHTAADILNNGGIVAFPTETVYGLGANAFNTAAVEKIYKIKNRPLKNPLIVHIGKLETIEKIGIIDNDIGILLIKKFWPGPLTIIIKKKDSIPGIITNNKNTVAVRFPKYKIALDLINQSTGAIAAPSANPFGYISASTFEQVYNYFNNKIEAIIDGGNTSIGIESTILDLTDGDIKLLRHGGISIEEIESVTKMKVKILSNVNNESPGQFKYHYSPNKKLKILNNDEINTINDKKAGLILFKKSYRNLNFKAVDFLSVNGNIKEAAANLYRLLYKMDNLDIEKIYIEDIPYFGIGNAIMDRIKKASNKNFS